ncbi:hypothetical protein ACOZ4F_07200 [Haloarcula marismortui]|uniref:hypothetical protein n=1 Tax=Haloarcula marismortui TaxID=2238 RepID=UPI0012FE94F3|nr:hypothetical protein [Haloarcula taiwanensis]
MESQQYEDNLVLIYYYTNIYINAFKFIENKGGLGAKTPAVDAANRTVDDD